jgi:hypothetical protein
VFTGVPDRAVQAAVRPVPGRSPRDRITTRMWPVRLVVVPMVPEGDSAAHVTVQYCRAWGARATVDAGS